MAKGKEKEAENVTGAYSRPVSSENRTEKALMPKVKIAKKSLHKNLVRINKFKGIPQVPGKKSKKKSVPEGNKEGGNSVKENEKKLNSSEIKQKGIADKEQNDKSGRNHKTNDKLGNLQKKQQNQKNKKRSGLEKQQSQINKERRDELDKNQQSENKKEKLGGMIFMCNAKTKPDCFRYRVMGVPISKKDIVLGIKPGLKLFLYDFDLRLMYGIYKASSSGGLKLEPTAFNGGFPVQVRFVVHQDCYPLPESVFKKAIKDNYGERHRFNTELTVKQVKKLIELFRSVEVPSTTPAILPQPAVTIQNREAVEGPFARDSYTYDEARRYSLMPRENDQHLPYRVVPSTEKEELRQDAFLSEKEYRTYGLRREIPNPIPPTSHIASALEPYPSIHAREHLRHPPAMFRDIAPPPAEPTHQDPVLVTERGYQTYGIGAGRELQHSISSVTGIAASALDSYPKHPHYTSHYGASSVDPYPPPSRRDEVPLSGSRETYLTETDHLSSRGSYLTESDFLKRREDEDVGRLYSIHASSALSDYNRTRNYQGASSRYTFAGPSLSYR